MVVRIALPTALSRYVVEKGSITVDGVSLTVSGLGHDWFEVSLIPTTLDLTTLGRDVNSALIGERWRVGGSVLLEVSCPRVPCRTFQGWLRREGWIKQFTLAARPGAYLRVLEPGEVRAGDPVEIRHRPDHDVTVALVFRALTREPALLPQLLVADALPEEDKELVARRLR